MIQGAIFDIDGTILDSMPIWDDVGARYLTRLHIEPEPGLGEILFSMSLEEGAAYLQRRYSLVQTRDEIRQGVLQVIADFYRYEVQLKPGADGFLRAMAERGIPMTLATTSDAALTTAALTRLGVEGFFIKLFTCTALNTTKHEAKIYRAAAQYMGSSPEKTLVFEDVLHALKSAKSGGFRLAAVEDAASAGDRAEIRRISDIYLRDYWDLYPFWEFASQL